MAHSFCPCPRCRCRGLVGPVMLITLGVLFLIAQFTRWDFRDLWPVILIVLGVLKAVEYAAPMTGHRV